MEQVHAASEDPALRPHRALRLAGVVADALRDRILGGELSDGDRLPKEDELRAEFGVGRPAMREAMRILEEEGLVTVLRGNRGGAAVHTPRPATIAYALGLVLSSRRVPASDVAVALRQVEPACAALCADRSDRRRSIVPDLRRALNDAEDGTPDPHAVTAASRRFHEVLVAGCGNETLIVLGGVLEMLWSSHVNAAAAGPQPARRGNGNVASASGKDPRKSLQEHYQILELIVLGDAEATRAAVSAHLHRVQDMPTPANQASLIHLAPLRSAFDFR